jgi:hypothetical protein
MPKFVGCDTQKYVFWSDQNPAIAMLKADSFRSEFFELLNNSVESIEIHSKKDDAL